MKIYLKKMHREWTELIQQTPPEVRQISAELARQHATSLSISFYQAILDDPEAELFLTSEQVEKHLKQALANWTEIVLSCQLDEISQIMQVQQRVGEMHARIGIPVQIVEMGARTLKKLLLQLIKDTDIPVENSTALCQFIICSIDLAMEVMSRVFSFSENSSAREDENYRIFSLLENAEEEKERQTASLLSWETNLIYKAMVEADLSDVCPLGRSDFGLWFNHKGRHYFSGLPETGYISKLLIDVDELLLRTREWSRYQGKRIHRNALLYQCISLAKQSRNLVNQIITFLKTLFEEISRHEVGLDVLTRLLNRRFMPTIFKREILHASRNGSCLSVLIIDVDHFKQINDAHGHHLGDEILRKISLVFYNSVRSSDYVFRYGGDEFLIVLTEAGVQETRQIAERICVLARKQEVKTDDGQTIVPTLSIGCAMFSGHPDYERLIQSADTALYRAKAMGRNRVELALSVEPDLLQNSEYTDPG